MHILKMPRPELTHRQRTERATLSPDNPWSDYVGFPLADEIFQEHLEKESGQPAPDATIMEFAGKTVLSGVEAHHEQDVRAV